MQPSCCRPVPQPEGLGDAPDHHLPGGPPKALHGDARCRWRLAWGHLCPACALGGPAVRQVGHRGDPDAVQRLVSALRAAPGALRIYICALDELIVCCVSAWTKKSAGAAGFLLLACLLCSGACLCGSLVHVGRQLADICSGALLCGGINSMRELGLWQGGADAMLRPHPGLELEGAQLSAGAGA